MGNTEISDTDTDTGGKETALSLRSQPPPTTTPRPLNPYAVYYILYIYRIPTAESCIPNPTAQFAQLCDDNGKHFYCVSTSLSVLLLFCLVPFFVVVPFVVLIVVVVVEYLYLLQVFVCRFTASISIFGPSSAAGSNSAEIPFCPL